MQGEVPLSNDGAQNWVTRKLCGLSTLASVGVAEEPPGTLTDLRGRKGQSERPKSLFRVCLSHCGRGRPPAGAFPEQHLVPSDRVSHALQTASALKRGGSGVAAGWQRGPCYATQTVGVMVTVSITPKARRAF